MKKRVLLHICCGICAFEPINRLKQQNYEIFGFYYNPNIYPYEEYIKRKKVVEEVSEILDIKVIYGDYEFNEWFNICKKYDSYPEGSERCNLCFELRLRKTYHITQQKNIDFFTTTLTISPHKNSKKIIEIAKFISKEKFLEIDFKKHDGFKNTITLSKKFNLYRQNYCGCIYSLKV